jgi:hypothetical protein
MLSSEAVVFNEDDFGFPRSYGSRNGYKNKIPDVLDTSFTGFLWL